MSELLRPALKKNNGEGGKGGMMKEEKSVGRSVRCGSHTNSIRLAAATCVRGTKVPDTLHRARTGKALPTQFTSYGVGYTQGSLALLFRTAEAGQGHAPRHERGPTFLHRGEGGDYTRRILSKKGRLQNEYGSQQELSARSQPMELDNRLRI